MIPFENGLVKRKDVYSDSVSILRQLGLLDGPRARSPPRRRGRERDPHAPRPSPRSARSSASTTLPVSCQKLHTSTAGPAPEIVAPIAPSSAAESTSSSERG